MEDKEALKGIAVIYARASEMRRVGGPGVTIRTGDTADTVDDIVNHLLANGIVATSIVVGSIFLPTNQQLGVEELAVVAGTDLIDRGRVEIDKDGAGDIFAVARLGEEGLE